MKHCSKCGEAKPPSAYHRATSKRSGHASACKTCESARKQKEYRRDAGRSRARAREHTARHRASGKAAVSDLMAGARRRANQQGVRFELTRGWLEEKLQRGLCEVSGLPFEHTAGGGRWKKQPFSPSVDRIVAGGPYTPNNCRVVCLIVNEAMNQWGLEPLIKLVGAMRREN